jgi:hypothetical protein
VRAWGQGPVATRGARGPCHGREREAAELCAAAGSGLEWTRKPDCEILR